MFSVRPCCQMFHVIVYLSQGLTWILTWIRTYPYQRNCHKTGCIVEISWYFFYLKEQKTYFRILTCIMLFGRRLTSGSAVKLLFEQNISTTWKKCCYSHVHAFPFPRKYSFLNTYSFPEHKCMVCTIHSIFWLEGDFKLSQSLLYLSRFYRYANLLHVFYQATKEWFL